MTTVRRPLAITLMLAAAAWPMVGCQPRAHGAPEPQVPSSTSTQVLLAAAPPFTAGQFPCTDCHEADLPFNPERRVMQTAHQEIELRHGGERMWCFDCHDRQARDSLHTAGGELLAFDDAHLLCGQCHQGQFADWQGGAHGKRTGKWNGAALALRCAACHPAHAPKVAPIAPEPAPRPPRTTR